MSSCSAASRREDPPSTRAITRMRMSAEYAFGMARPPDESMPPDSPIYRSLGILRFYSARTCSRFYEPRPEVLRQMEGVGQAFFEADWDGADHRPASLTSSNELTSFSSTTYDSCSDCRVQSSLQSGRFGTLRLRKIRRDNS